MPVPNPFSRKPPEPEPKFETDGLTAEQISIIVNRWRNLMDADFSPEEAFKLCSNPRLDWHYAAELRASGCPFEIIVNLTTP